MNHDHASPGVAAAMPHAPMATTRGQALTLAMLFALGLALRIIQIDAASYWVDEAFSVVWIREGLGFLWTDGLAIETTPPLYYTLLKGWVAVFGDSELAVRMLGALASAATILVVFALGREFAGTVAGLLAAAVFAANPLQIYYAQEARVYAFLPLLFGLALLGLLRFVQAGDARRGGLVLYGVSALGLIYAHATSVFTVAALTLCCGAYLLGSGASRAQWRGLVAANIVVAVLAVPQLWAITIQAGRSDLDWIQPPDLVGLLNIVNALFVDPVSSLRMFRICSILAVTTATALVLAVLFARLGRLAWSFAVAVPAVFLVMTIALSFYSPFLIARITLWIGVPLAILAGLVLQSRLPLWSRAGLAALLVVCGATGLHGVYVWGPAEKEDWRGMVASIAPQLGPADIVAVGPSTSPLAFFFYGGERFGGPERPLRRWNPRAVDQPPYLWLPADMQMPLRASTADLARHAAPGRQVWLALRPEDWVAHGSVAMAAVPPPSIDRSRPGLILLRW